jgi:hypothetical protein
MALQFMHLSTSSEENVQRTVSTTISDCIIQMQFFLSVIYILFSALCIRILVLTLEYLKILQGHCSVCVRTHVYTHADLVWNYFCHLDLNFFQRVSKKEIGCENLDWSIWLRTASSGRQALVNVIINLQFS